MNDEFNPEPSPLAVVTESCLAVGDYGRLLEETFKPESLNSITADGMDLITKLCENGLKFATNDDAVAAISKCLIHVVTNYRPKEALICLLEQAEAFVHCDKFTYLLPALQYVMLQLPKKREKTFSWVLSTLKSHMKYFNQVPDDLKTKLFENYSDTILFEEDPKLKAIWATYRDYIDFYKPFVEELQNASRVAGETNSQVEIESLKQQRLYLGDYLVDLLGIPLIHFNLDWERDSSKIKQAANSSNEGGRIGPKIKTDARIIAETLMGLINNVDQSSTYYFDWIERRITCAKEPKLQANKSTPNGNASNGEGETEPEDDEEDDEEIIIHMTSLVSYFYLLFNQNLNPTKVPAVFSPTQMFNMIIHPVTTVLKSLSNHSSTLKALRLSEKILSLCDTSRIKTVHVDYFNHRLNHNLLATDIHQLFISRLAYLSVYNEAQIVRVESYKLLKKYLWSFEPHGRYDFLNIIFNMIPSDTLVGHMITELKQFVILALDNGAANFESEFEEYFLGNQLCRMLLEICILKQGVTTNLADNSNKIISTLNLIRFLLLKDCKENKTGFMKIFPLIEKNMLEPLRKGLDLSKAHYELNLRKISDPHLQTDQESEEKSLLENFEGDLVIGGKAFKPGDISTDQRKASILETLNCFDHMYGLLSWLYEAHPNHYSSK